jgi:hypothetical protein
MKEKYSKRGAFKRNLDRWGEIITFDYLYSGSQRAAGLHGEKECLVIKDLWSGMIHAYPTDTRLSLRVVECLKSFTGKRKIHQAYSDNAP